MADESEKVVDAFLQDTSEEPKEPAPQAPPKSDEQTVADTARKSGDTTETSVQKAAKKGNKSAKKVAKEETEEEKTEREERERQEAEDEEARIRAEANRSALEQALDTPTSAARRASNWIASAPTPGGISALLLALLFFLWVVIPVNSEGDTRMKLLWYTLIGRTKFTKDADTAIRGSSADFGNSGSGTETTTTEETASIPTNVFILSPFDEV